VDGGEDTVRTTVVVPAYRAWATLPTTLDALRPQVERHDRELILVDSSGELDAAEIEQRWPWVRAVVLPERTLPGRARNIGVGLARGSAVAFTDADAVPEPDWLGRLEEALEPGVDAVAGAVLNGTPWSVFGTAGYLLEFSEWLPQRRGAPGHGATCNLLVRRSAFAAEGGFLEGVWPGEDTILTFGIARRGRLAYAPHARVRHVNRTTAAEFLRHQRRLGSAFVAVCSEVPFPYGVFADARLWPLAVALRSWAIAKRLAWEPAQAVRGLLVAPVLLLGLLAWASGLGRRKAASHRAPAGAAG
jgi:cellulose synthase/poly-beta-1,6-N-acetylglucosamine synthase-like glycosyltransferase